jgi:hypothetical protein
MEDIMADYKVDKQLLESNSTEEIIRILKEERDDYTPEAISIFEEILRDRKVQVEDYGARVERVISRGQGSAGITDKQSAYQNKPLIGRPGDAVAVLNDLLVRLLSGTIEPQTAQVAGGLVMGILRAMEQEFLHEPGEE